MPTVKTQKRKVQRSAKTGKFVSTKFAKRHKATTYADSIKYPVQKKKK